MSLKNKRILITCGPTWVPIDDTRVISNRSTGRLGRILAESLLQKGARVTFLEGPVEKPFSSGHKNVRILKYCFFDELKDLLKKTLRENYDAIIHAAAVSDYRVDSTARTKIRSGLKHLTLRLKPTEKLIRLIRRQAPESFLVGFKMESTADETRLRKKARELIKEAGCNLVVANTLRRGYRGLIFDRRAVRLAKAASRPALTEKLVQLLSNQL